MSEWSELYETVKKVADKAVKKTEEFADSAAKHVVLHRIEAKLSERYENLGKLTYKQLKTGESQAERIAAHIESIDRLRAERKALMDEIDADKAKKDPEKIVIRDAEVEESVSGE